MRITLLVECEKKNKFAFVKSIIAEHLIVLGLGLYWTNKKMK